MPRLSFNPHELIFVGMALLMMPLNWYLEAVKWQLAVPHEKLTLFEGVSAVLGGLALNWAMPFASGDLLARLANVADYRKTVRGIITVRVLSLGCTVVFGGYGTLFFFGLSLHWVWPILMIALGGLAGWQWSCYRKKKKGRLKLVLLSVLRLALFSAQYALLIETFVPELNLTEITAGIGWVFLFKSALPSLFGGLGIREASAFAFFDGLIANPELILVPTALIWAINKVIPSIIGVFLIFNLKYRIAS